MDFSSDKYKEICEKIKDRILEKPPYFIIVHLYVEPDGTLTADSHYFLPMGLSRSREEPGLITLQGYYFILLVLMKLPETNKVYYDEDEDAIVVEILDEKGNYVYEKLLDEFKEMWEEDWNED